MSFRRQVDNRDIIARRVVSDAEFLAYLAEYVKEKEEEKDE